MTPEGLDTLIYHIIALSERDGNPHPRSEAWLEITQSFTALQQERDRLAARLREYEKILYIEPDMVAVKAIPDTEAPVLVPKSVRPLLDRIVKLEAELHRYGIYE